MNTPTRDKWIESARLYIVSEDDMCDCDCFLCIQNEHDEHCDPNSECNKDMYSY